MTEIQFFYRKDNQQIDAVYKDCKSSSVKYVEGATYKEANIVDPPYIVTRDHKVILDGTGNVINTELSINPIQPYTAPTLQMSQHAGQITGFNPAAIRPLEAMITQNGVEFFISCFVTQDLVDAYQAKTLDIGDWVLIYFLENDIKRAIAQQKVYKTW